MKDELGSLYTPSKWGQEYHVNTCNELLGAGAAGPGKTMALLMDPVYQLMVDHARMMRNPALCGAQPDTPLWDAIKSNPIRRGHSAGWALHLRRSTTMLLPVLARAERIFRAIDPGVSFRSRENMYQFSCGFRFQFGHCNDPGDWENYFSFEFTHIAFDELVQFMEEQYDQIKTRLRTDDPVLEMMLKVRAMSNPVMKKEAGEKFYINDPFWVRRRFVEPAPTGRVLLKRKEVNPRGEEVVQTRMYLPATLYDNPNPAFVKQYEATLLHTKSHIRKALLYGDWYVTAGSFFAEEWDPGVHICKPFKIPVDWPVFRSMDWGFKKPGTVGWYALDEDDNLIKFKELNFVRKTATRVAEMIRDIEKPMGLWGYGGSKITGPADTQLWEDRGDTGVSKAAEMAEVGVMWVHADKRSRQRNAERISERLLSHENHTTRPGIVFFEGCRKSIQTIPAIQTSTENIEEPADGGEDHWVDETGYACAYASAGREGIPGIEEESELPEERDEPHRGNLGYGGA